MIVPALLAQILGWRRALGHAVVLILAGALVSFVVSFVARSTLDRAFFESGLSYSTRTTVTTATQPGGIVLSFSPRLEVAAEARPSADGSVFLDRSTEVSLATYAPTQAADVAALLGRSLTQGTVGGSGVLLDEATAVTMNVGPAGTILLVSADMSTLCKVQVDGLTRPFRPLNGSDGSGLVMVPDGLCPAVIPGELRDRPPTRYLFAATGQGTMHASEVLSPIASSELFAPTTLAILAVALTVWLLAVRRTAVHVNSALVVPSLMLLRQGVGPRLLRVTSGVMVAVLCVIGAAAASNAARLGLALLASLYVQPIFVAISAALLAIGALPLVWIEFRTWPLSSEARVRRGDG